MIIFEIKIIASKIWGEYKLVDLTITEKEFGGQIFDLIKKQIK